LRVSLEVDGESRAQLVGRGGGTIRRISEITGARCWVPPAGQEGPVRISAQAEENALAACASIAQVVDAERPLLTIASTDALPSEIRGETLVPKPDSSLLFRPAEGGLPYFAHAIRAPSDPAPDALGQVVDTGVDNAAFSHGDGFTGRGACVGEWVVISAFSQAEVEATLLEVNTALTQMSQSQSDQGEL